MKIFNLTKDTLIAEKAYKANTLFSRMIGLLSRTSLSPGEALVLTQCKSIHMFFMRFPIDAIFVSRENKVVGMVENLKPFHLSPIFLKSSFVVELPAGTIEKTKTQRGDLIRIEED